MKILHICLASFYIDNFSYQENLLPKYHKKMGFDVEIIASLVSFDEKGKICILSTSEAKTYINENDIKVTRLNYKKNFKRLRKYEKTLETIKKSNPDIIFIHGCQFLDIKSVVKYVKKNPNVKIFADNHADFSNSATNWISKNILHKIIWKKMAHLIEPYTTKFYGVLPARVDFLRDVYKLPEDKLELLVMGVDDEKADKYSNKKIIKETRRKFGINDDDFLIVTGGKIDLAKTETLQLMEAIKKIDNPKLKLLIFGSIIPELKEKVENLVDEEKIQYLGWATTDESFKYFGSADLVVFPGRHSVYWEQVVGQGIPMIVKYWEGTTHVDMNGNCEFLLEGSTDEIIKKLKEVINKEKINKMKSIAISNGKKEFSYSYIAKKSLEIIGN